MSVTPPSNGLAPSDAERVDELLADRAVFGLDAAETAELERLLAAAGLPDDPRYEVVAAAASVVEPDEPLPPALRGRLLGVEAPTAEARAISAAAEPAASVPPSTPAGPVAPSREWPIYTMLAVAAGLLISLYLGSPGSGSSGGDLPPAAARTALLAEGGDLVQASWAPQDDPAIKKLEGEEAYGDVVWSDERQAGYMRFRGLKPNDPEVEQYQLWIFDKARDFDYPVDGGVFDITSDGEQVVPIRAKLPIHKAKLFAVTVEKPGGVVVSDRSRLPLMAKRQFAMR